MVLKITVAAVGQSMPAWAVKAWEDYAKRFPPELKLELKTFKTESRNGKTVVQCIAHEERRILSAINGLGKKPYIVVWDERGQAIQTTQLAQRLRDWEYLGVSVALVLGGPDGLTPAFRSQAQECLRLSDFTLPHAMARILLVEQLYRAWSINARHPYHRG